MSGWIKFEKDLETDPRVLRMARELKRTCNAPAFHPVTLVCGGLVRMWAYADAHIREDDTLDMSADELDEVIGIPGFCSLLPEDWFRVVDEHTVELPGFQEHNGVEAKKRDLTQKRVERHRAKKKRENVSECNSGALPDQTRPDQTRPINGTMSALPTDVSAVFEHWKREHRHPQAQITPKRLKVIRVALKSYTPEQLCRAISGYRNSAHHMGHNEQKTVYDSIELFLRDAQHIDAGLKFAEKGADQQWQ